MGRFADMVARRGGSRMARMSRRAPVGDAGPPTDPSLPAPEGQQPLETLESPETLGGETTAQEVLDAIAPVLARDPRARLVPHHAGRYTITDVSGRTVGTLYGDYVVGFTVEGWGQSRWYADLEEAKAAIAAEAQLESDAEFPFEAAQAVEG